MTSDSGHSEPMVGRSDALLPGAALKERREKGGFSLEDVSKDTRITCSRLIALENDDYAKVGSHPFVVGYIRKYAKWLNMDDDELVRAYEEQLGGEVQPGSAAQHPTSGAAQARRPTDGATAKKLPLLWLLLIVIAAWVVAAVYLSSQEQAERSGGEQRPAPASAADDGPQEPASDVGSPVSPMLPLQPVPEREGEEPSANQEPSAGEEPSAPQEPSVSAEPSPGAASEPSLDTEIPAEGPFTATEPSTMADGESDAETAPPATDTLAMSFTDSCWVEVRDAQGNLLFAQLQEPGDNLQLRGAAPFQVLLGNAHAVSLQVNGRAVDTNPGAGRNTLRLRVGP